MHLNLSADEVLTTTRSVRKRLDLTRPVEPELITECIQIALQAPTGSNSQAWQWMVVTDDDKKKALADLYAESFDPYIEYDGPAYGDEDPRTHRKDAVKGSAKYLRQHFHEVPAMVIPLQAGRADGADAFGAASYWGSILPAVWSFMLALRERGLGSAWTTLHLPKEREAAEVLGIPFDDYTQAGLFPVAYTIGTEFKQASRVPAEQLIHWNTW